MNSRLKPQRIKPSELSADKSITAVITSYEIFNGVTREGIEYEEDRVYFLHNGTPAFLRLNQKSLLVLASHGFTVSEEGLSVELPERKLTFSLISNSGPYPFYVVSKIAKKGKEELQVRRDSTRVKK